MRCWVLAAPESEIVGTQSWDVTPKIAGAAVALPEGAYYQVIIKPPTPGAKLETKGDISKFPGFT